MLTDKREITGLVSMISVAGWSANDKMPGVGRRLFNLAAGVSLIPCAATIALGIASYFISVGYEWAKDQHYRKIEMGGGHIHIAIGGTIHDAVDYDMENGVHYDDPLDIAALRHSLQRMADHDWCILGFEWLHWTPETDAAGFEYGNAAYIPGWGFSLPGIVLGILIIRRMRRGHLRLRAGKCLVCGYDLRATPERCPECGAEPKAVTEK